ncbi:MAG: DDE-type integrase/transposase/recombinase [Deltaproteobacteria bacterium]|nr:DDE-type integrase/transposase/recombinase [Deltaproteobacteria bacterium]
MKEAYTAKEIAAMKLQGFPSTKAGVLKRAESEAWPFVDAGKGKTFAFSDLPEPLQKVMVLHAEKLVKPQHASEAEAAGADAGQLVKESSLAKFNTLPQERQEEARARLMIVKARNAFLTASGLGLKKGTLEFCRCYNEGTLKLPANIRKIIGEKTSLSSINRWAKSYKKDGLHALASKYVAPNKGKTTLSKAHDDFIVGVLYTFPHISIEGVYESLYGRFGKAIPHIAAVRRFVNKWKQDHEDVFLYMTNPDAWKNKSQVAFGSMSEHVKALNQLWEFDSTPADLMLIDGRYTLIGVIDVYSRRLKLLVSKTSKSEAVAALTRHALLDWGVPETVKTDNGADYVSNHLTSVFDALEIEQKLCPPFTPEAKPHIERAFKTFAHSFVELMPGYIGHSVADRKAIEARKSFAARLGKKGGTVELPKTSAELQQHCDMWTEEMYHTKNHGSLGMSPEEAARRWTEPVRTINDERALDLLLAPVPSQKGIRVIGKKGISVDNYWYQAAEFGAYMNQPVSVFYDVADMGNIYVYRETDNGREFLAVAVNVEWQGIDRAEFATRARKKQLSIMQEASREFKQIAKKTALQDIHREILDRHKEDNNKVVSLPKAGENYSTPALDQAALAAEAIINRERPQKPATISAEDDAKALAILDAADKKEVKPPVVSLSERRDEKIADDWEKLDGWERYEMLLKLSRLNESQVKWIEYYKTTREFEYLQDIYEEGGEVKI